jgi:hypothetical protein
MDHIVSILLFVIIILILLRNKDKSRAYHQGREDVLDSEYPYILKGYSA